MVKGTYFVVLASSYLDEELYFERIFSSPRALGINWPAILFGSLLFSTPLQFLSACYRFDFVNAGLDKYEPLHSRSSSEEPSEIEITTPINSYESHGLSCAEFEKPYFTSALAGWVCSALVIAALYGNGVDAMTYAYVGVYSAFVSPLVMTVGVGITSALRGEMRKVWTYKEEWGYVGNNPLGSAEMSEVTGEASPLLG